MQQSEAINSASAVKGKRDAKQITKAGNTVAYEESKQVLAVAAVQAQAQPQPHEEVKTQGQGKVVAPLCPNCQTSKPKAAKTPYVFFSSETVTRLLEEAKGTLTMAEAGRQCGQLWKQLTEDVKSKYITLHLEDVERHKRQKEELAENGFFVMADGQRSCDVVAKKSRGGGESAHAAKAVKTRDRGTQTLKTAKQRPTSATAATSTAKPEKKPAAAEDTTAKRPAGSAKQNVLQKRPRLDDKSQSPAKQEMSFGSPSKRAKTTATGSERQAVDASQRKSPSKKASAAQSAAMASGKKAKNVSFAAGKQQ